MKLTHKVVGQIPNGLKIDSSVIGHFPRFSDAFRVAELLNADKQSNSVRGQGYIMYHVEPIGSEAAG